MTWLKAMLHVILIALIKQTQWSHWWWHQHYIMLMLMILDSQNSHFKCFVDFNHLTYKMVPLMMPLMSHNADTNANGITLPKMSCCTPFWLFWPKKHSSALHDAISIMWCQCWCHWHHMIKKVSCTSFQLSWRNKYNNAIDDTNWQDEMWCQCHHHHMAKKSCCTSFQLSWPSKCNGVNCNAFSIMWCQCWCQWNHMTKNVMLHLILIILT